MNKEMLKVVEVQDNVKELLQKNTIEEVAACFEAKGAHVSLEEVKEFVQLVSSLKAEYDKASASGKKIDEKELIDNAVGGAYYDSNYYSENSYNKVLDNPLAFQNLKENRKNLAWTICGSIVGTLTSLTAVGLGAGYVYTHCIRS